MEHEFEQIKGFIATHNPQRDCNLQKAKCLWVAYCIHTGLVPEKPKYQARLDELCESSGGSWLPAFFRRLSELFESPEPKQALDSTPEPFSKVLRLAQQPDSDVGVIRAAWREFCHENQVDSSQNLYWSLLSQIWSLRQPSWGFSSDHKAQFRTFMAQ